MVCLLGDSKFSQVTNKDLNITIPLTSSRLGVQSVIHGAPVSRCKVTEEAPVQSTGNSVKNVQVAILENSK